MLPVFGSGNLYGATTQGGVLVPRKFGVLQNVSLDIQFDVKELYGQQNFAFDIARGKGKIAGKAAFASLNGALVNDLFFGMTASTGQKSFAYQELGTIPGTPYTITVANAGTFYEDLGVTNAGTGVPLTRVSSGPTTGQYSVSAAGVYTFAAADTSISVMIDYSYTTAATGTTIGVTAQLMGVTPNFVLSIPLKYKSKTVYLRFPSVMSSKLTIATKLDDYTMPDFEFAAMADVGGNVMTWTSSE